MTKLGMKQQIWLKIVTSGTAILSDMSAKACGLWNVDELR